MRRRHLLSTAGAAIFTTSGCLDNNSLLRTSDSFPTISVQPDEVLEKGISMGMEVTRQFSGSAPAKIEISFTNESDSEIQFTFGSSPPFSQYVSQGSSSPKLVIIPVTTNSHISVDNKGTSNKATKQNHTKLPPETTVNDCWELPGNVFVYGTANHRNIVAGETISEEYAVLSQSTNWKCLPPNYYRFVSQNYFGNDQPWGFTIHLKN